MQCNTHMTLSSILTWVRITIVDVNVTPFCSPPSFTGTLEPTHKILLDIIRETENAESVTEDEEMPDVTYSTCASILTRIRTAVINVVLTSLTSKTS